MIQDPCKLAPSGLSPVCICANSIAGLPIVGSVSIAYSHGSMEISML